MAEKDDKYTYRVIWSKEDSEHVGLCSEFPTLSWLAASPEAALKGIRKLVAEVVTDMVDTGEPVWGRFAQDGEGLENSLDIIGIIQ